VYIGCVLHWSVESVCKINVFVYDCSPSGKGILSGHADGSIVRYFLEDEGTGETQVSNSK